MGTYLIPNIGLAELPQAIYHIRQQGAWTEQQVWDWGAEGGVLFTDPARDDAGCAALYTGFVPNLNWAQPLPDSIRLHLQHMRDYLAADEGTITNAQTVHVIKDLIRAVHFLNSRLATDT